MSTRSLILNWVPLGLWQQSFCSVSRNSKEVKVLKRRLYFRCISAQRDDLYSLRTSIRSICIWNSLKVKLITFLRVQLHALSLFRKVLRKFFLLANLCDVKTWKTFLRKRTLWGRQEKVKLGEENKKIKLMRTTGCLNWNVMCFAILKLNNISLYVSNDLNDFQPGYHIGYLSFQRNIKHFKKLVSFLSNQDDLGLSRLRAVSSLFFFAKLLHAKPKHEERRGRLSRETRA